MNDRGGVPYLYLPVGQTRVQVRNWVTGALERKVILRRELRSVTRAARPDGMSGRQWTKLRKARQRAKRAHEHRVG